MRNKEIQFYIKELRSEQCQCGRPKKPGRSFCYWCYSSLPREMQRDLYQSIGDGYEAAYEEAVAWLNG